MVDFGNRLKELRTSAGMTQKQLAYQLGVTKSVVSYYVLQECSPSPEILIKLSHIFHVSVDYLLGLERKRRLDVSDLSQDEIELIGHLLYILKKK